MPWQTKDLSPSIWHKLYVDSLRTTAAAYNRYVVSCVRSKYLSPSSLSRCPDSRPALLAPALLCLLLALIT